MWENKENLAIFTVILMAAFGNKNVHSAMKYYLLFMFFKKSSFKTYVEEKLSRYDVVDGYWRITYKTVIDDFLIIPKIKSAGPVINRL